MALTPAARRQRDTLWTAAFRDQEGAYTAAELEEMDREYEYGQYLAERRAEEAAERFYEEGPVSFQMQYQWEIEQDERNAAFYGGF